MAKHLAFTRCAELNLYGMVETQIEVLVGGGGYEELEPETIMIEVAGAECMCLSRERLIKVKRAAGRPKDLEAIAELEQILEEGQQA